MIEPNQTAEYWLADCPVCGAVGQDYCQRARCENPKYVEGGEREVNAAFNDSPGGSSEAAGESPAICGAHIMTDAPNQTAICSTCNGSGWAWQWRTYGNQQYHGEYYETCDDCAGGREITERQHAKIVKSAS